MAFNFSTALDKYFNLVVTEFEDSFNAAVVRETETIDPETRAVIKHKASVAFERMNWVNPEHRQEYSIKGRLFVTDAVFLVSANTYIVQGDNIINLDTNTTFDVLGIKTFTSHKQVNACFTEQGFNDSLPPMSGKSLVLNTVVIDG